MAASAATGNWNAYAFAAVVLQVMTRTGGDLPTSGTNSRTVTGLAGEFPAVAGFETEPETVETVHANTETAAPVVTVFAGTS